MFKIQLLSQMIGQENYSVTVHAAYKFFGILKMKR